MPNTGVRSQICHYVDGQNEYFQNIGCLCGKTSIHSIRSIWQKNRFDMMAEKLGLDSEVHELKLGSSFGGGPVAYHSIRYDFKPASVDTSQVANVDIGEGNSVTVTVPHVEGSGTAHTVYKGNKKPCQKECVLIIDHQTGEITLEKLATNIQLKKTSRFSRVGTPQGERRRKGQGQEYKNKADASRTKSHNPTLPESNSDCEILRIEPAGSTRDAQFEQDNSPVCKHLEKLRLSTSPSLDPVDTAGGKRNSSISTGGKRNSPISTGGKRNSPISKRDSISLVHFSESIEPEIAKFLSSHEMEKQRRPYVSHSLSLQRFREDYPDLYSKTKKRLSFDDGNVDALNSYLCANFSQYLVDSSNIYGCVQRMEDVVDYIIAKYTSMK